MKFLKLFLTSLTILILIDVLIFPATAFVKSSTAPHNHNQAHSTQLYVAQETTSNKDGETNVENENSTIEEEENEVAEGSGVGVELWTKGGDDDGAGDYGPFDDEETRVFYSDIPDLLTTVPPALLSMSVEEIEKRLAAA